MKLWEFHRDPLSDAKGFRFTLTSETGAIGFDQVILAWRNDADFRREFNDLLAGLPFTAFRWETPPVSNSNVARPFEFVVLNSPSLARPADPEAFAEHFDDRPDGVVEFPNLGRNAILVVPCPTSTKGAYTHLADFVRHAPEAQRDALWGAVGEAMSRRVGKKPVWLNTAGGGVAWLHVRLDDSPKYYGFDEYRTLRPE